jgi:hypothetical protein
MSHYIDDSGTHDNARLAVMGGPVVPHVFFSSFQVDWDTILSRHKVAGPIHMKEFYRPHGRLAYLSDDERMALFQDLVSTINKNKLYSLTVSVLEKDFKECFPSDKFKSLFGPAPLAFIWCMVLNQLICDETKRVSRVAYLVSETVESSQIVEAHRFVRHYAEINHFDSIGAVAFDSHKNVNALQAADMIAWSNRKKMLREKFDQGFEPLERLTRTVKGTERGFPHFHFETKIESTRKLADIITAEFPNPPKIGTIKLLMTAKDRKRLEEFSLNRGTR